MTLDPGFDAPPSPSSQRPPVAVLLSRFPSVTETFILREVVEMESQQQPVVLVPMLRDRPPVIHEAARPWTARALYTRFFDFPTAGALALEFVRQPWRLTSLFARLVAGTLTRPGTLLRTLAVFPKSVLLARELRRRGVRHVHAHFATHPTTMALVISTLSRIPFSFTVHAHDIQLDRALLRWKLREARFVRSISEFNRRFLSDLYPESAGKIEVIHVGIEPERYVPTAIEAGRMTEPEILCVAGYRPYKGLRYLVEACAMLRDEGVVFRCDLVGHGPLQEELEALIRELRLEDVVRLAGPRPENEVARMMSAATIFVLPSIIAPDGQMEGIPVALMEAMASGRPVVSTSISGIPELIEDGVSGRLVPPGDAAALASAIRSLLTNPSGARQLGQRARAKVREDFALAGCVTRLNARLARETAP
jgi:colanic acid/amylovoran biosynthesis glycosyltransferase